MRRLITALILVVLISFSIISNYRKDSSVKDISNENSLYEVVSVTDGDTIKLYIDDNVESVRLIGIDTPETVHPNKPVECFGSEASNRAKEILEGQYVKLETDASQGTKDKYDRLLGYLILADGRNFNKLMIEEGYAYEYTYSIPYKYQEEFKQAEIDAKNNERGLWAPGVCEQEIV